MTLLLSCKPYSRLLHHSVLSPETQALPSGKSPSASYNVGQIPSCLRQMQMGVGRAGAELALPGGTPHSILQQRTQKGHPSFLGAVHRLQSVVGGNQAEDKEAAPQEWKVA